MDKEYKKLIKVLLDIDLPKEYVLETINKFYNNINNIAPDILNQKEIVFNIIKEGIVEGVDMIPIEQIITEGIEKKLSEKLIISCLNDLENKGKIYKPRHHFYKLVRK